MPTGLSEGKQKGLEAVADSRGIIAAIAIDQRSALRGLFSRAMGVGEADVPAEKLSQFKEAVSAILTPHASAILLDPEYGLPAAGRRAGNAGLLLAYEQTGYGKNAPGRLPRLLDQWSVKRLVEAGANAVKLLLYYSSRSSPETNDFKQAFVEKVGAECAASDTAFFLELVSYAENMDEKGIEFARIKPEVVAESMKEFSKPVYGVDVLKVGVPVNIDFVEGSPSLRGAHLYCRAHALGYYRRAAAEAEIPFIYLSQGVRNETFQYALELAGEAGVAFSGVLCGRATWKDGVEVLVKRGERALEDWLHTTGAQNIQNVNRHLKAAVPWQVVRQKSTSGKARV
jgi:tagatose 1,6-diphosphate aldolase